MDDQRTLQLIELDILKHVSTFCKTHNIKFSLYGGTLLGAIRHKGFIPWDDDLDICMLREDYDRFLSLWNNEEHIGYIIQNKETDPDFTQSFTKIRKDHTTFIQEYDIGRHYHKGIFIDIFPLDRMPVGISRYFFKAQVMLYQLCCREFVPPKSKSSIFQRLISRIFLFASNSTQRNKLRKRLLMRLTENNGNPELGLVSIETVSTIRYVYPPHIADKYKEIPFEDSTFPVWADCHDALMLRYGDYMKLPPVEERSWTHHPLSMSFNKNENES